jgi:hypothetical protein
MSDWKERLNGFMQETEQAKAAKQEKVAAAERSIAVFVDRTAVPALAAFRDELERHGRESVVFAERGRPRIEVKKDGRLEFEARIECYVVDTDARISLKVSRGKSPGYNEKTTDLREHNSQGGSLEEFPIDDVLNALLEAYISTAPKQ